MTSREHTRAAWEDASQKHVREYAEHLELARVARLLDRKSTRLNSSH